MSDPTVEPWLLDAVDRRSKAFADQLRTVADSSTPVPGMAWTVADLGQHFAGLPWHFRELHEAGEGFDRPDDWAAWGDSRRAHITETDPEVLADLVESEYASIIAELRDGPDTRWFYGFATSPATVAAMMVNEGVMHGRDLAGVTGAQPPTLEANEAHAAANATMLSSHIFVDPDKAAQQPDGVYHIKFRGGKDFTWTKQGGELIVTEGKPPKADAHLNTDAGMFMMSSLGRIGQVKAALSGKMTSYGRKPWRFLGLSKIVADGV